MIRALLPRPWCEVDYRGQILLVFGALWTLSGIGNATQPPPTWWVNVWMLNGPPQSLYAGTWVLTGLVAMAYALRPRMIVHDGLGFVALYLMPAYCAASYLLAWLDYMVAGWGGVGYPRGWLSALIYIGLVFAVMICARGLPRASVRGAL